MSDTYCQTCKQPMRLNVPRLGPDGGFVHRNGQLECPVPDAADRMALNQLIALRILDWTAHRNPCACGCGADIPVSEAIDWEYSFVPPEFKGDVNYYRMIPNYAGELGAIIPLVRTLPAIKRSTFLAELANVCGYATQPADKYDDMVFGCLCAEPWQLAVAYIRAHDITVFVPGGIPTPGWR